MGPPGTSRVTLPTVFDAPRSRRRPTPSLRLPKSALVYVCVRQVVPSCRKPLPPEGSTLVIVAGSFREALDDPADPDAALPPRSRKVTTPATTTSTSTATRATRTAGRRVTDEATPDDAADGGGAGGVDAGGVDGGGVDTDRGGAGGVDAATGGAGGGGCSAFACTGPGSADGWERSGGGVRTVGSSSTTGSSFVCGRPSPLVTAGITSVLLSLAAPGCCSSVTDRFLLVKLRHTQCPRSSRRSRGRNRP